MLLPICLLLLLFTNDLCLLLAYEFYSNPYTTSSVNLIHDPSHTGLETWFSNAHHKAVLDCFALHEHTVVNMNSQLQRGKLPLAGISGI